MSEIIDFKILTKADLQAIALLGQQLNSQLTLEEIRTYLNQMFAIENYKCFGLLRNNQIVGIASAWTTVRLYSGKQLELDNVVIDKAIQSQGLGKQLFGFIEKWAKENEYKTIELNTYVQNAKSHKFYFNLGYSILGFHFWKSI